MARGPSIVVGDFTLDRLIGRGGMAEVWYGRHTTLDRAAAIKVMRSSLAADAAFVDGFRREVRAVAGLDHPGIVGVFDTGAVDEAAAAASGGALSAGSPWLAMEYAAGGDLTGWALPLTWGDLHAFLLEMLDALAHAHARGVIHRDLKPANILVRHAVGARRVMLTDFGIAHMVEPSLDSDAVGSTTSGTPHYMAPEQVRGRWRDYGPWTDLYALGCLAYELACGRPPYEGKNAVAVAMQQVSAPIPSLGPTRGAPPGFGDWVRRLMAKRPEHRFEKAADAAWHLARLPAPRSVGMIRPSATPMNIEDTTPQLTVPSGHVGTLAVLVDTAFLDSISPQAYEPTTGEAAIVTEADHQLPPMPPTWRLPDGADAGHRALGTGLFAVRETPFVGREDERDQLWRALTRVRHSGRSAMVLVESAAGCGKTRLAEWFARRAEEVGAAIAVRVDYGPVPSPLDGILAAMRGWFQGDELTRPKLRDRIEERLKRLMPFLPAGDLADAAGGMAALLDPAPDAEGRPASPAEQRAQAAFWLRQATDRRPLVLRLDDVHFGLEGLALAEHILSDARQTPILIVATLNPERLPTASAQADVHRRLRGRADVHTVSLGPLPPADHARYVNALIELAPGPLHAALSGTGGDPWFAAQLVASWVEDGALTPGPEGYDAVGELDVPADVDTLVRRRIERLAAGFDRPERVRGALWAAAALGHTIERGEWKRLCAVRGTPPPAGLVAAMADRGWARTVPGGWAFTHDAWRAGLVASARDAGTWTTLNGACARVLRAAPESPVGWQRIARHHAEAEAWPAAMHASFKAARMYLESGDYRQVIDLAAAVRAAAERAGSANDVALQGETDCLEAEALKYLGRTDAARAILDGLDDHPLPRIRAHRLRISASMLHFGAQLTDAERAYQQAAELYRREGDVLGDVRCQHGLGWVHATRGDFSGARRIFAEAAELARVHEFAIDEAWCLHGQASAIIYRGESGADVPAGRALATFERLGARGGQAAAQMFVADALGLAGRFDEARGRYRDAIATWEALGSNMAAIGWTGLGLMLLDAGDDHAAREAFDRAEMQHGGVPRPFEVLHLVGIGLAGGRRGDLTRWIGTTHRADLAAVPVPRLRHMLVELAELTAPLDGRAGRISFDWAADAWRPVDPERAAALTARARRLDAPELP